MSIFLSDGKKTTLPCFTMCFAKAIPWDTSDMRKKMLACQIFRRKCNGKTSSSTRMLLFWQRHRDNAQRAFRQEWSWVRNLSVRYIFSCCFIDNNARSLVASLIITFAFHCKLYLIHNEWSRRLEKIRCNIKCFPTLSWPWRNL